MADLVYIIHHREPHIQLSKDHIHRITITIQPVPHHHQKVVRYRVAVHIWVHRHMYQVVLVLYQIQPDTMAKNNRFHPNKLYDCSVQPPHRHQFLQIIIIAMVHGTAVDAVRPAVLRQQHIR